MVNTLRIILRAGGANYLAVADAIDLSLRNIKFGDDIQEYLENKDTPEQCKALVEVITGFIEGGAEKVPMPLPVAETKEPVPTTEILEFTRFKTTPELIQGIWIRGEPHNKIGAIKAIRTITSCNLKDAKDFIDSLGTASKQIPTGGPVTMTVALKEELNTLKETGVTVLLTVSSKQ